MIIQQYYGAMNKPKDTLSEINCKELSDNLYQIYDLDINYQHFKELTETILYTSYFLYDYKNYNEVVNNLETDMFDCKFINSLLIAFMVKYGMIFHSKHNERIIEYESGDNLQDEPIIKIIECISKYIKEKDICFDN